MKGLVHPATGEIYEIDDDEPGLVRVSTDDGRWGRFTRTGTHVDGDIRWADPHVCGWVMTSPMQHRFRDVAEQAEH